LGTTIGRDKFVIVTSLSCRSDVVITTRKSLSKR